MYVSVAQMYLYTPWATQNPDLLTFSNKGPSGLEKVIANEQKLSLEKKDLYVAQIIQGKILKL